MNFGAKPFQFDIEGMIAEEREQRQFAILQSNIPSNACHNIVCSYLKHYGYAETLKAFDEESFQEQVKANEENPQNFGLEDRKKVRNMLFEGNVEGVRELLISKQPELSGAASPLNFQPLWRNAFYHLSVQQFIELMREDKYMEAVELSQSSLSLFYKESDEQDKHLKDVLALLAYKDPHQSPVGHLMTTSQRENVADVINTAMLEHNASPSSTKKTRNSKSVLEKLLVQLCRVQAEIRRRNDNKGEIFKLEHYAD